MTAKKSTKKASKVVKKPSKKAKSPKKPAQVTKRARAASRGTTGSAVVLLSGGNPQIAKGDGPAPVKAYLDAVPGWKRDAARRLDALIVRTLPHVKKAVRWNSPFYGIEGQGWFLSYHCFDRYLKVTFLRGQALVPLPPVESKDPNTRYFHIFEKEPVDEKLLADWLKQVAAIPGDPLF